MYFMYFNILRLPNLLTQPSLPSVCSEHLRDPAVGQNPLTKPNKVWHVSCRFRCCKESEPRTAVRVHSGAQRLCCLPSWLCGWRRCGFLLLTATARITRGCAHQNPKFQVQFLLSAYHFHTIENWEVRAVKQLALGTDWAGLWTQVCVFLNSGSFLLSICMDSICKVCMSDWSYWYLIKMTWSP